MKKNNRRGFTITELVIVIAVIAILAAVLIPTFSSMIKKANDSAVLQKARYLHTSYIGAVNYTAGESAESTALIKVVKDDDTYYVKVVKGVFEDTVYPVTQMPAMPGKPLIEADDTAVDGVKWTIIPCADNAHVWGTDNECTICDTPKP